jgi:CRP-like cAMP-binding protein
VEPVHIAYYWAIYSVAVRNRQLKKSSDVHDTKSLAEAARVLTSRGWLSTTPTDFQRAFLACCKLRSCAAGSPVFHGGADDADMHGIVSGVVDVSTRFSTIDVPIAHIFRAGSWLGSGPILSGQPRRVSATARTPTMLAQAPHDTLKTLLAARPEWWRHIACLALEYGDIAANTAADLMIRDSPRRCVAVLLRLCGARFADGPDAGSVDVPVAQEELAAMANVSRNTLGTVLRELERSRWIAIGYRSISVLEPGALRRLVDGV